MSGLQDKATAIINMEGDADEKLRALKKLAQEFKDEIKKLGKTPEADALKGQLKEISAEMQKVKEEAKGKVQLIIDGKTADASIKDLRSAIAVLRKEINGLNPNTQEFVEKTKTLQQVQARFDQLNSTVKGTSGFFAGLTTSVKQLIVAGLAWSGIQTLFSQMSNFISKNAKLSDSLADIQRVAGLTKQEVLALNKALGQLDTRTGTEALRGIAIIAGKLGVAKGDIAGFTQEVDKLVVTLGDELGGADEITSALGKILNVFDGKITADNISKLGNAFVVLANEGVATGGFIADFTQRLSGIATAANLSLPATVGLAAGLEEMGQKVESSSTAVSKLIVTIGQDLPKAAKIAGAKSVQEVEEFSKLFAEKPEQALLKFAAGLQKNKSSFAEIASSFKDAGEEGARVISTLAQLGQKGEFFSKKIADAGEAMKSNTAINAAFALKNETLGASLEKLGKRLYSAFSNSAVSGFLSSIVVGLNSVLGKTTEYSQKLEQERMSLLQVETKLYDVNLKHADRVKLIEELKKQYPDYLKDIDAETASNEELGKSIRQINEQLVNKIVIQTQEEAIQKQAKETAEKRMNQFDAEQKMVEAITVARDKYGFVMDKTISIDKNARKAAEFLQQTQLDQTTNINKALPTISKLNNSWADYTTATKQAAIEEEKGNKLLEIKTELMKKFGMTIDDVNGKPDDKKDKAGGNDGKVVLTAEQLQKLDEVKNKIKQLDIELAELRKTSLQGQMQTELNALEFRYDQEKKAAAENNEELIRLQEQFEIDKADVTAHYQNKIDLDTLKGKYAKDRQAALKNLDDIRNDEKVNADQKAEFAAKTNRILNQLDKNYLTDRNNLYSKFDAQRREEEFQQDTRNLADWHDSQKLVITEAYADGTIKKKTYDREIESLEQKTKENKVQIAKDYGKDVLAVEQAVADGSGAIHEKSRAEFIAREKEKLDLKLKLAADGSQEQLNIQVQEIEFERDHKIEELEIDQDYAERRKLIEDVANKEIEDLRKAHLEKLVQTASDAYKQYADLISQQARNAEITAQNEIAADKAANDAKRDNLKNQLDSKKAAEDDSYENKKRAAKGNDQALLKLEKEHNAAQAKLDKDYKDATEKLDKEEKDRARKAKHEAWVAQHEADIEQAVINTALAVSKALSSAPFPFNLPLVALAGALGLEQINIIQNQPEPTFGKGKPFDVVPGKGGVPSGPSHKEGGIDLIDTKTRKKVGNMEGREPILSVNTYENNKEIVDLLLDSSLNKNGAPIFENGKLPVPAYLSRPSTIIDTRNLIESIRIERQTSIEHQVVPAEIKQLLEQMHGTLQLLDKRYSDPHSEQSLGLANSIAKLNENLEKPLIAQIKWPQQAFTETQRLYGDILKDASVG